MKRSIVVLIIGILMVGSVSVAAVALASSDHGDDKAAHGKKHSDDDRKGPKADNGHGPPPWAHHGDKGAKGQRDAGWKEAWRKLTPAERAEMMAKLAQQHADGMKKWAACVKAAGKDDAARARCTRPLPPGLAKKLLGNSAD